jgi:hypothetical protein
MDHMGLDSRVMPNDYLSGVLQHCVALLLDNISISAVVEGSSRRYGRTRLQVTADRSCRFTGCRACLIPLQVSPQGLFEPWHRAYS